MGIKNSTCNFTIVLRKNVISVMLVSSERFLSSLSDSFLRTLNSIRVELAGVDAVRPRGSSRSCTHSGKSRMSNVAAGNRFGGKSVATTLSLQAAFVVIVTVAVAVEVFSLGDREAVQILMCKFTVSRLPPPHAVVRTTSLDPEVSRDFDHRLRSDSNCYQSRRYARNPRFVTFTYKRGGILHRGLIFKH